MKKDIDKKEVLRLWDMGLSGGQIGEMLGVSRQRIHIILKSNNVCTSQRLYRTIEKINDLKAIGMTLPDIAKEIGQSLESVAVLAKKEMSKINQDKWIASEILQMYNSGYSQHKIAKLLGIIQSKVNDYLQMNPEYKSRRESTSKERREKILLMRSKGMTHKEIAWVLGVSQPCITKILAKEK